MPRARTSPPRLSFPRVPRQALAVLGIAFGAGLLLFLLVWWSGRDPDFYRAEPVVVAPGAADTDPLPQPQADGEPASDMPDAGEPRPAPPRVVEAPTAAPATEPTPPPAAPSVPASAASTDGLLLAPGDRPVPIEGRNPPPRYPPSALRAGRSGTVGLRVDVNAQGLPTAVTVVERSGSRDLDRAASDAIRRWQFHPAQRDGRAVPGSLVIPVTFDLGG